jgi:hypothetical protein
MEQIFELAVYVTDCLIVFVIGLASTHVLYHTGLVDVHEPLAYSIQTVQTVDVQQWPIFIKNIVQIIQ